VKIGPDESTDNEIARVEFRRMIGNGRDLRPRLVYGFERRLLAT
jgi:hypothetical protein